MPCTLRARRSAQPAPRSSGTWYVRCLLHHNKVQKGQRPYRGDLMTCPVVAVGSADLITYAAQPVYTLQVKRLSAFDAGGHLAGAVSRPDVLAVWHRSNEETLADITDEVILHRLASCCPAGHSGISPCSGKTALRVAMIARSTGSDGL
jgi:hypothetical protein